MLLFTPICDTIQAEVISPDHAIKVLLVFLLSLLPNHENFQDCGRGVRLYIPLCVCSITVLRTYLTQGAYSRTITLSELLFSSCGKKQHVLSFLSCSGHDARNGHIHLLSHLYSKKAFLQLTQFRLSEARSHS